MMMSEYVDPKEVLDYVFTFGVGHPLKKNFIIFRGNFEEAREKMIGYFGIKWAFQYPSKEGAGVDKHGLIEIEHDD